MKSEASMKLDWKAWIPLWHLHKEKTKQQLQKEELKAEIQELLSQMQVVQAHFDQETDFSLIEAHIMQLKALEMRYNNAIGRAKQMRLLAFESTDV